MATESKTVLILGGGVGGLVTANELRKGLPKQHRIIVVDRAVKHLFYPSLLWLMTGLRQAEKISRDLAVLERKGIEVVQGEISALNPATRSIVVNEQALTADYLVISLGTELDPGSVPGLSEAGYNLYDLEGTENLRRALKNFREGKLAVVVASTPYKCPAAPYEAALLLEYDCRKRKIRNEVELDLYAAEPGPMGVAGPKLSAAVRRLVEKKGIDYHPDHHLSQVDQEARILHFSNGHKANYDLLAYVPPHRVPRVVAESGLALEGGWVSVNRYTLETRHPSTYAIGDITGIPLAMGKPLPKAGVFAHAQAEVVAHNIAREITGKGEIKHFSGHGECFIELGDRRAGFARGDFYGEPTPQVKMFTPGPHWHAAKLLFEKDWLRRWF